jgi:hypothetical protein
MKKLGSDGVWMESQETLIGYNTRKEPGIDSRESIKKMEEEFLGTQKAIKRIINSLPLSSLRKLLGKKPVNPYIQGKG